MLTPSFHFQILEGFFDDFNRNADILNGIIEEKLLINREMDIFPLLSACTLDIISGKLIIFLIIFFITFQLSHT